MSEPREAEPVGPTSCAWVGLLLALGGCGGAVESTSQPPQASSASQPARAAAAVPEAKQLEETAAPAPVETAPVEIAEPLPSAPSPKPKQFAFQDHYPSKDSLQLSVWKKEHHASGGSFEQTCWELAAVGVPALPGLLCVVDNRKPEFRLARVYRLEGAKLREVWQATIATYTNWLLLTPLINDEGASLTLHDRSPNACWSAAATSRSQRNSAKLAVPSWELIEPACKKIGDYQYEDGRYHLSKPHEPPAFYGLRDF